MVALLASGAVLFQLLAANQHLAIVMTKCSSNKALFLKGWTRETDECVCLWEEEEGVEEEKSSFGFWWQNAKNIYIFSNKISLASTLQFH